jgi:hypothetical protein
MSFQREDRRRLMRVALPRVSIDEHKLETRLDAVMKTGYERIFGAWPRAIWIAHGSLAYAASCPRATGS